MKKSAIFKLSLVIVIIAVGFLGMFYLSSSEIKSNKRDVKPEVRLVNTMDLEFGSIPLKIEGNGVIESQRSLKIISEAGGKVVFALNNLKDGTGVKEGETVVKIDTREVENTLFSFRSDYMNAVASILPEMKIEDEKVYKKWLDYFSLLDINSDIPELPEVSSSQEKIKISSRDIYSKYFRVKNQEILLTKHTVNAPFDGIIKSEGLIENSFVTAGQTLFTINDVKNLEIAVPLLVEEYNQIDFSSDPDVTVYTDKSSERSLTGKLRRKDSRIERNSQTVNVYITFKNSKMDSWFLPGSYVNLLIEGITLNNVATVPRHTVDSDGNIFTYEEGHLGREKVEIAAFQGDDILIKNTMPQNTKLVTTILQKPIIGMQVRTESDQVADKKEENSKEKKETLAVK